MINKFYKDKDGNIKLSEHFSLFEFASHDGFNEILVDLSLIPILERFRQYVEASVPLNSAYRTISYNTKIGGAKNSYHTKGQALDIPFKKTYKYLTSVDLMCAFFNTLKVKGIIKYSWGVHIDTRKNEYHAKNTKLGLERTTFKKINIPLYKNIKYGDNSNDVGVLQFMLKQYGYNLEVDCKFGNITRNALKDFQRIKGLTADGICRSKNLESFNKISYSHSYSHFVDNFVENIEGDKNENT